VVELFFDYIRYFCFCDWFDVEVSCQVLLFVKIRCVFMFRAVKNRPEVLLSPLYYDDDDDDDDDDDARPGGGK